MQIESPSPQPGIRSVPVLRPLRWLRLAWQDSRSCGWVSYAHGLLLAFGGALLLLLAGDHFWLLAGAFSGFLVVAPILATGLYALSRALDRGEAADARLVLQTWLSWRSSTEAGGKDWRLVQFGLLLGLAGTGWVLTSAALITLFSPQPVHSVTDFLRYVVVAPEHFLFALWLALGGVLAAPVFASTAVAIPLLLDRRIGLLDAVLTSWRCVLANPIVMAFWASLIMLLTLLGMAALLLGLVLMIPLLGHASWHAYRDLVDAALLPERVSAQRSR